MCEILLNNKIVLNIYSIKYLNKTNTKRKIKEGTKMRRKRSSKKENKGITLIALVVTIVVLLVLASISINMTIGENGVVTRAQQARITTELDSYK